MAAETLEPPIQTFFHSAEKFIAAAKIPSGKFDPAGDWRQTYAIWMSSSKVRMGELMLEKQAPRDNAFELRVDWKLRQQAKDVQRIQATIQCANDALGTPRSWHGDPVEQLFDMRNDSGETKNLASDAKFASALDDHRKLLADWESRLDVAPVQDTRRKRRQRQKETEATE